MNNRYLLIWMGWLILGNLASPSWAQLHPFVNPLIGSEGLGNVFIGPSAPYGMIKPGPDNDAEANSGYSARGDMKIFGFSQVHVSGTGGGAKYGNISVMPFSSENGMALGEQESLRRDEHVALGYYSVVLDRWNIQTQITT